MCGIAGIINYNNNSPSNDEIQKMMRKMKHRGPDDDGIFIENKVGLGFVRLSIIDLSSAGHQPMMSSDGRYVIVYNGEVYNYLEIKKELKNYYNFITKTDTEVVLAAYQKWGEGCLDHFNGMFAFAIYDRKKEKVFCARDRYGIKPFYYYNDQERFIFASEIKSLLPLVTPIPNDKIIYDYLVYNRTDHSNETFFKGIKKLNHGHTLTINNNKLDIKPWYRLREKINRKKISFKEYRGLFNDSLKLRLRSDVPIGVCLSGGLDSSSIVSCLIEDQNVSGLNTFSAVYKENSSANEEVFIDEYKSIVNNMHKIYPSAETFYTDYLDFIQCHTEPTTDVGPYVQYKVMELAKDYVKVTLDGQGADEQLAGYHNFFGSYYVELINNMNYLTFISENYHYWKKHNSKSALAYFISFYKEGNGNTLNKAISDLSVNNEFINTKQTSNDIIKKLYNPNSLLDSLLHHFEHKLEHLLRWEDINAMNFSIESRVPFLDYRLVESTLSLPSELIINNGISKYVLRESMKDILPNKIYNRLDKKGFSSPRADWFRSKKFISLINRVIDSHEFKNRAYFDHNIAKNRYQKHLNGEMDISSEIWKWINLEFWFKSYID